MKSLPDQVLDLVYSLAECSTQQAVGYLHKSIDSSRAATAGRRIAVCEKWKEKPTIKKLLERGVHTIIADTLRKLAKQGKIRRIRTGVYGPPLPKIADVG